MEYELTKKIVETEYGADQLLSLSPIELIRKRPNLSLGVYSEMQKVALREIIDNSTDEFRAGYGKKIKVTIHEDGSATIEDAGRGVPTDINKSTGENGIYMAFGKVGSGGKFGTADSGYSGASSLGLNGVGTTATNATSSRFDVTVYRSGKKHRLSFREGLPGHWDADNGPQDKFTPSMDIKVTKDDRPLAERKERPSGTTTHFWPDKTIFGPISTFRIAELRDSLRSTAFLIPGICFEIDDRLGETEILEPEEDRRPTVAPQHDIYEFDGGISEMLELIAPDQGVVETITLKTEGSFKERVPVPQPDGVVKTMEVERVVDIDIALRWGTGYNYTLRSFVNTINTSLHGTHVTGMERALSKVLLDSLKGTRLLKVKYETPNLDDVREGLTVILNIQQNEPNFIGQEKQRLGGTNTQKVVNAKVIESMTEWMNNKKNANSLKMIQQKIVNAAQIRAKQRQQKDVDRRKTALQSASMPAKLVDCSEIGTEHTELLIAEGDSALGTLKNARDSRYQALLPIRGKILNVQKASAADILQNTEITDIIQVIGAGSGRSFDISKIRVARVIIAADADIDGAHIATLIVTLMAKLARPFVEEGRLYAAVPPLYTLKTRGKNAQTYYLENEEAKDKLLAELSKKKISHDPLSRLKGLGEMDAEEFWHTTLNPETRTLRQITMEDVAAAEAMLELAMGKEVAPRKAWIMSSRSKVSDDELDIA